MLPTEDAAWVGEELTRRFGLPRWLFTLTATDANRTALRIARLLTGRPKVLVYSYCYHGSVDEAFAVAERRAARSRAAGNVGPPVDLAQTTTRDRVQRRRRAGARRWRRARSRACWPSRR